MFRKSIILIMVLMSQTMAITIKQRNVTFTTTPTTFIGLSQSWYLSALHEGSYWGLYAKKKTTIIQGITADLIDTLNIASYYDMTGGAYLAHWTTGSTLQSDIDSVKNYLNKLWTLHPDSRSSQGLYPIGIPDSRRDTVTSYIQIFKFDSICAAIAIPNSNIIRVYKNYLGNWNLKTTITTASTSSLLTFTYKNNQAYFTSNNDLYKISSNCEIVEKISDVLGYFLDNQGIWLTNSSNLSYLKNGTRAVIKTGLKYACKIFAVNPIDTTFFYNNRLENSIYGDIQYTQFPISFPIYLTADGTITDYINAFFQKGNYLNVCRLPRANRDLIVNETTQEITYQIEGNITVYKFNYTPFFYNTFFADSLGHLNEVEHIVYQDTIRAFDYSLNDQLIYSIIQNPIGIVLTDSILTINSNLTLGTYVVKFQVKDNFSISAYDTITWNLKVFSRKISVSKNVATTASENNIYSQTLNTTDIDDDSSYIYYSSLPSWLTLTRLSQNQFNIIGTPNHSTTDTMVKIIMTDSSYHYDAIQKQNMTATFDTLTYNITISLENIAPVITAINKDTVNNNQQYLRQVQVIDEQPLTYTILLGPVSISQTGLITWTPTDTGKFIITFKVTDTYGLSSTHNYVLVVKYPNRAPVFTTISNDTTIYETDSLLLTVVASDPDGTIPNIKWYSGETLLSQTNSYKVETDYTSSGIQIFKVIISDEELSIEKTITINILDKNRLPIGLKDTTITIKQLDVPFIISAKAVDPDGDKLIYSFDPTSFNVSNLVVEIKDSVYKVTLKKIVSDTLIFIVSDGKTQTTCNVYVIADIPTSVLFQPKILKNSFSIIHGSISYSVAKQSNTKLVVYSMNGRIVYKLNKMLNTGSYKIAMNLASGSYVCHFAIDKDFVVTNKMQIIQ